MLVGIDFDNTIVCYDRVFHALAVERNWIDRAVPENKQAVRDQLRASGREALWTELQALAYGDEILQAEPFAGVRSFLRRANSLKVSVAVVSHKTQFPYAGRSTDLHLAARRWLQNANLLSESGAPLPPAQVYFEESREQKLARIAALGCTCFIDDLPEFLLDPGFPPNVKRVLFDPHRQFPSAASSLLVCRSWREIERKLLHPLAPTQDDHAL